MSAAAQSRACETLLPLLEEDELRVYNRGRNADPANIPKHAQRSDYHRATAFEAVFGYLHLSGRTQRMQTLFNEVYKALSE